MAEITTIGEAAYSVLCKMDPFEMQRKDPEKFQKWMDRQLPITRYRCYFDIGVRLKEQEAKNG